ncbi:uncharacterized protein CDAR_415201 [Caerostris darwini]|uniref:Uncharacterized protein n=1 Tax=Caerostris darwini TaxID=1538125 RepID=A0AAV4TJT1_9ARAC|nr:uncharacterized protein CDAR_415201 [Caerostris darwini]
MVQKVCVLSDSRSSMKLRISQMLSFNYISCLFFVLLWSSAASDSSLKNHRIEKRQDGSFLFFGGWRPLRPRNPFLHSAASTHDILSALPNSYDPAASFYTHALPTQYHKDIYSYYPRPAIKSKPKKNTPTYMERYRPQMQQQKQGPRGISSHTPQFFDFQNIDFHQLKELHQAVIHTKGLPLSPLHLPIESVKPVEVVQISLQSLQQGGQNYGFSNGNGYGRRRPSHNRKSGYRRPPQSRKPVQSPVQFEYVTLPKAAPIISQNHPKEIEITPIQVPQHNLPIEEVIDVKNIQIVEVPSIAPYDIQESKGSSKSQYSKSSTRSNQHYKPPAQSSPQKNSQLFSYYTHQTEQPRKHQAPPQVKSNHIQIQPEIEAELVKLSDEDLKTLLSTFQGFDKNQHEVLKYLPLSNIGHVKDDNIQLVVSLPESGHNHGGKAGGGGNYESQNSKYQSGGHEHRKQPQAEAHSSKDTGSYEQDSGSYKNGGHNNGGYQIEEQRSNQAHYEQENYQNLEEQQQGYSQQEYGEQQGYHSASQRQHQSAGGEQQYSKSKQTSKKPLGVYGEPEQPYIQVISPQTDEHGYRREPVLAIEIQHGQTIEDAIKSLDRETLQKLGTHGKNGIEIEVVEVPIDDYTLESKKTETVVSPTNSTVLIKAKKPTTEKS